MHSIFIVLALLFIVSAEEAKSRQVKKKNERLIDAPIIPISFQ